MNVEQLKELLHDVPNYFEVKVCDRQVFGANIKRSNHEGHECDPHFNFITELEDEVNEHIWIAMEFEEQKHKAEKHLDTVLKDLDAVIYNIDLIIEHDVNEEMVIEIDRELDTLRKHADKGFPRD